MSLQEIVRGFSEIRVHLRVNTTHQLDLEKRTGGMQRDEGFVSFPLPKEIAADLPTENDLGEKQWDCLLPLNSQSLAEMSEAIYSERCGCPFSPDRYALQVIPSAQWKMPKFVESQLPGLLPSGQGTEFAVAPSERPRQNGQPNLTTETSSWRP